MKVSKSTRATMSQAEFARHHGVSKKTVTIWKGKGFIALASDGSVDVEASSAILAQRPEIYRGGVKHSQLAPAAAKPNPAKSKPQAAKVEARPAPPNRGKDPAKWTLIEAQVEKETYLARLRRQEFETKQGDLVSITAVVQLVEAQYAIVRDRLMAIPGKLGSHLTREQCALVAAEVREALDELHDPSGIPARIGGSAGPAT